MITNKKIRDITFLITIVSLVSLIGIGDSDLNSIYYDIVLAIFGGSLLSCLTAQISYNSDIRKINRTIISNVLQIQAEVKKILFEYKKTTNNWEESDFYQVHLILNKLINEFLSYSNTIKYETGKEVSELIKVDYIFEIYDLYISLEVDIHNICDCLKDKNKDLAIKEYRECRNTNKKIVEKVKMLLEKEYGKNFADINSIGLL